jgi:serine/threonine protein kinase
VVNGTGDPEAEALIGTIAGGKYRLNEVVGRGAMGIVFGGVHEELGRRVAVKVLRNLRSEDAIITSRFRREARAAAQLNHMHSVQVLDFGEDDARGFLYLVMERVDGKPLSRIIREERRLSGERAIRIMLQVCDVLGEAHELGIIHRDIKPSNILIRPRRTEDQKVRDFVKVCDFGLARFVNDHADPEATQDPRMRAAGTPIYMSPEQAVGDPLDTRTDVYSSGVVLYHLLAGRPPFIADSSVRILMMQVSDDPPPLPADVRPPLRELIGWCLQKMPQDRCPSMLTFRTKLREVLTDVAGIHTTTSGWSELSDDVQPPPPTVPVPPPVASPPTGTSPPLLPLDAIVEEAPTSQSPPVPAGDEDIEALVAEAVAEVAAEGTSDFGHQQQSVAGLDVRRHSATISDAAVYMYTHYGITYEPYHGPHPFYARDHRGELLGPMSHRDLWLVVQKSAETQRSDEVLVSGDSEQWVRVTDFIKWIGQESLLEAAAHDLNPADVRFRGQIERSSVVDVLARLARDERTGRIWFRRQQYRSEDRMEVHTVRGRPTFVYSSETDLQVPDLLVKKGLLPEEKLPVYLHRALVEETSLEGMLAKELHVDVRQWRTSFMKERLLRLLQWSAGEYFFSDAALPAVVAPFSDSLLIVLKDLVHRAMEEDDLVKRLEPVLDAPPRPSERLRTGLTEMRLTEAQATLLHRLFRARTLREGLDQDPARRRVAAGFLFVLVEAGLILPP